MIISFQFPLFNSSELFVFLLIPVLISGLIFLLGLMTFLIRESKEGYEAYECGFDPFLKNKSSFCIRFFNIAILYLLIDLEIALILPFFLKNLNMLNFFSSTSIFKVVFLVLFLIFLLWIENWLGGLSWKEDLN